MEYYDALPEGCVADIVSRTTPVDACRLSLVFKTFCSAAHSDDVWDHFLPSDFMSIISRSDSKSSLLANSPSKKSLYLALSHHPIIIDDATKSFQLDRKSGKKCYMLAAKDLIFAFSAIPEYWNFKTLPESRFPKVVELIHVCGFEIYGAINTNALSPNTQYAAYLVFKMIDGDGLHHRLVDLSVDIVGGQSSTKNVCLDSNLEERKLHNSLHGLQLINVRNDGWLEIEIREFFNSGLEDYEVHMSIKETNRLKLKTGRFIEGIEVRPKEGN